MPVFVPDPPSRPATVRAALSATYKWPHPDLALISQFATTALLAFAGPNPHLSADLTRNGATTTRQTHNSLESWISALPEGWDALSLDLRSADSSRHARFDFDIIRENIRANLDNAGPATQSLEALLTQFREVMSLDEPMPPVQAGVVRRIKDRLEGHYYVENPGDVAWFKDLLNILEQWTGEQKSFVGSYSRISTPQFQTSPALYAEWKTQCTANWKDILVLYGNFFGELRDSFINYSFNRADLRITLSSENPAELLPLFADIEKQLNLRPSKDSIFAESRKSERRRYFALQTIDIAWFERCAAMFFAFAKGPISFQGRFQVAGLDGEGFLRTKYGIWRDEVIARWNELISVYFWISTPDLIITTNLDLFRDLVTIEIQSPVEETIAATFATIERGFTLDRVEHEGSLYRGQRFLRTFNIKRWTTNKNFAETVQTAVESVFPGRIPARRLAVINSFVIFDKGAEETESFGSNYRAFYDRLASAEDFTVAEFVIEGPQGRTIGIRVNRKDQTLAVRTSIKRTEVDDLSKFLRNALPLSVKDSKDEPDDKEPHREPVSWTSILTTSISVVCALIAGSVALITSQRGLSPLYRHYGLQIAYPQNQPNTPVKLTGGQVRLEWILTRTNITGDHPDLHSPASISILPEGETTPRIQHSSDGEAVVSLDPGTYYVRVVSDLDPASQASIDLIVSAKPAPTPAASALPGPSFDHGPDHSPDHGSGSKASPHAPR